MREAARAVASTDAPIGSDGDTSFGDLFAAGGPTTEDEVDATIRGDAVRRAVAKLPDRQRDVISLRFGLVGDGPNSLEQIGKQLGITRERVRQIEADALRRLRRRAIATPRSSRRRPAAGESGHRGTHRPVGTAPGQRACVDIGLGDASTASRAQRLATGQLAGLTEARAARRSS